MKTFIIDSEFRRNVSFHLSTGDNGHTTYVELEFIENAIEKYKNMFNLIFFNILVIQSNNEKYNYYKNCNVININREHNIIKLKFEKIIQNIKIVDAKKMIRKEKINNINLV